ncbi:MAG TPA: septum formation initiator family protein [Acetobacteraceae bacterium]|nr:septum formation initiator family protein [Acetobacteraceae bacterium]
MEIGRAIKRRVRVVAAPAFFLALVGYFGWNVAHGDHGLVAEAAREKLLAQAKQDLADAQAERDAWANRVSGLQADHIDADMLDEQARAMLNLSDPADVILMYPDKDKLY